MGGGYHAEREPGPRAQRALMAAVVGGTSGATYARSTPGVPECPRCGVRYVASAMHSCQGREVNPMPPEFRLTLVAAPPAPRATTRSGVALSQSEPVEATPEQVRAVFGPDYRPGRYFLCRTPGCSGIKRWTGHGRMPTRCSLRCTVAAHRAGQVHRPKLRAEVESIETAIDARDLVTLDAGAL